MKGSPSCPPASYITLSVSVAISMSAPSTRMAKWCSGLVKEKQSFAAPDVQHGGLSVKEQLSEYFTVLPIGSKPVSVILPVQRVLCLVCDTLRQVKVKFADPQRSYTRQFERYALDLSRHMTIKSVAQHLRVSWDVIKDIQKRNLLRRFGKPKLKRLQRIAIDEISTGKGHHYLTIVLDLRTGAVVFVGEGKGADALAPFWRRLKGSRARVQAVAIDMSPAYI